MANEDLTTLATRKLVIAIARSCIGAHYLKGGGGQVPNGGSDLVMLPNTTEMVTVAGRPAPLEWGVIYTAKNDYNRCSGKHGHDDVEKRMPEGDRNNPAHLASPDVYKWQRVVKWKNYNPVWGESCAGKMHFDCSGFVKWCLKQVIPNFMQELYAAKQYSIKAIRGKLEDVGVNGTLDKNNLCAADILIRKNNGHIGFAVGDGQRVIQAEWEAKGVVDTDVGNWDYHGRIPQKYWTNMIPLEEEY